MGLVGSPNPNGKGAGLPTPHQHQQQPGVESYFSSIPGRTTTPFDQQPQQAQLPPGISVQSNGMMSPAAMMAQRHNGMPGNFNLKEDLAGYIKSLGVGRNQVNTQGPTPRAMPDLPFQDPAIMRAFGHLPPHFSNPPLPPPNFNPQPLEQINQFGNLGRG
ncbi:hypothetical protein BT69DRAFT_281963 [Atractiella rhizophila]|nr:hypothetical protein BT69DRAFT_281963 [Atractiella rhizophila]